jgi:hypothetical protein
MRVSLKPAKRPFNIHAMLRRIRQEVKQFADAAMFDLAEQSYATPFHQLVACIISVRTRDEVSLPTAIRLFEAAPTAEAMSRLSVARIAELIRPSSFYETKAHNIRDLAGRVAVEYGGNLPCDFESHDILSRGRAEVRKPYAGNHLRRDRDQRRHSRPPRYEPVGLRPDLDTGGDASHSRKEAAAKVLGRDQPVAGAIREARVHQPTAKVLNLSRARLLPASRGNRAPLILRDHIGLRCAYFSFDLRPAICASVSPLRRKDVQSSIGLAPICL